MKTLLLAFLLFAPDASTRYHDAYVLEVIEGKVAEAAKLYLTLAAEPDTPDEIRVQCEFRFAVTCVLLGRADEARARLAVLAADPRVSAALKLEIAEYRSAINEIGVGSEVDKKLQELVFDLGHVALDSLKDPAAVPPYRDFLILGERAKPALRRLLDHSDAALRGHAFRLLCLLDDENLTEKWDLASMPAEFAAYLQRHPDLVAAAAQRFLDSERPGVAIRGGESVPWSLEFLESLSQREPHWSWEPTILAGRAYQGDAAARDKLLDWIDGEPEERARHAAFQLQAICGKEEPFQITVTPERFHRICELQRAFPYITPGLNQLASTQSADSVLNEMERTVEVADPEGDASRYKSLNRQTHELASALDGMDLDDDQAKRYAKALQGWLERVANEPAKQQLRRLRGLGSHLRTVLHRIPFDEMSEWLTAIVRRFPAGVEHLVKDAFEYEQMEDFPLLRVAAEALSESRRQVLFTPLIQVSVADKDPAYLRALGELVASAIETNTGYYRLSLKALEVAAHGAPEDAPAVMLRVILAGTRNAGATNLGLGLFFGKLIKGTAPAPELTEREFLRFQANIAVPAAAEVLEVLPSSQQQSLVQLLVRLVPENPFLEDAQRRELAELILRNAELISSGTVWAQMSQRPDLFPLIRWYPKVSGFRSNGIAPEHWVQVAAIRALGDQLVEHPETLEPSLVMATQRRLPSEEARKLLSRLIECCPADRLGAILPALEGKDVEPHAALLERLLASCADAPAVDSAALGKLAVIVAEVRASDRLVGVSRRLMAAEDPKVVRVGVALASAVASEALIPDLVKVLDSPDANLRRDAKAAIESIVDLRRFKEEARKLVPQPEGKEGTGGGG